jgi:hypothetical protein
MNNADAKRILLSHRPNGPDAHDPAVLEALALAERDPELAQWLERQTRFHQSVRRSLRQIPAPEYLRDRILAQAKIVEPLDWDRRRGLLAVAAAAVALLGLAVFWVKGPRPIHSKLSVSGWFVPSCANTAWTSRPTTWHRCANFWALAMRRQITRCRPAWLDCR